jgi:hypothetical protein
MKFDQHLLNLRGPDRRQAMASLLVLTRAAPHLSLRANFFDWTLAEAKEWVGLMKHSTRSYCPYPASHLEVLGAARKFPALDEVRLGFVEVALTRERDARSRRTLLRLRSSPARRKGRR